jgi:hypothetical protein
LRFTADLPDLNVWLAVHYWEEQAAGQVLFCTGTALGLVRLLSQPKLMGTSVKSGAEASAFLQGFCRQPGVTMAAPDHDGWEIFHWRLVSFDRDFQRFADLHWLALP